MPAFNWELIFKKSNHIYQQLSSEVNTLSGRIQVHVGSRPLLGGLGGGGGETVESKLNGQRDHILHKTKVEFPVLGEMLPQHN